jgi:hypothetical protein
MTYASAKAPTDSWIGRREGLAGLVKGAAEYDDAEEDCDD